MKQSSVSTRQRSITHGFFISFLLLYVLLFRVSLYRLAGVWAGDGTFQYGFLIFPISAFLIWSSREKLRQVAFAPSLLGMLAVAGSSFLWGTGELIGVQLLEQFAIIAMLPSGVLAIYGTSVARALFFPLSYLFFAFPWPFERLTVLLQYVTAEISVHVLQWTGFVTYLEGFRIITPVAVWHVADACSGVKFFLAAIALGALYAHLFFRSWSRRAIFMVLAFIVPIIANGFRVYFTVVIGEVFGVKYASGTDHLIFGWQFFGTVLFLFFLAGWHWRQIDITENEQHYAFIGEARRPLLGIIAIILVASGPLFIVISGILEKPAPDTSVNLTTQVGAWHMILPNANPLGANFSYPDGLFKATYGNDMEQVSILTAVYLGRPRHGHKLFMVGNRWFDPAMWRASSASSFKSSYLGMPVMINQVILNSGDSRRLVWYVYNVSGKSATGVVGVKISQLLDCFRGLGVATKITVISTPISIGKQRAEQVLYSFWRNYQNSKLLDPHGSRGA